MNTKINHLLACIGEECGEIQQVIGKSLRFGTFDINPKTKQSNFSELRCEVHDLIAVYQMLCTEFSKDSTLDKNLIDMKQIKVEKYMQYARDIGKLDKE